MTPRQKECLDTIAAFWDKNGYAPSYDDLMAALNAKSKSSVASLVEKLEQRGFIRRIPHSARSITIVPRGRPGVQ